MLETSGLTPGLPCSCPLLFHAHHLCTADESRLCQCLAAQLGSHTDSKERNGISVISLYEEKPGLWVGGRGPKAEYLGVPFPTSFLFGTQGR